MNAKALFAITVAVALLSSGLAIGSETAYLDNVSCALPGVDVSGGSADARADDVLHGVAKTFDHLQPAWARVGGCDGVPAEACAAAQAHALVADDLGS